MNKYLIILQENKLTNANFFTYTVKKYQMRVNFKVDTHFQGMRVLV